MQRVTIFAITFIVALCSIAYELIFAQLLTILFGNTVVQYSITIGLYLLFLGVGSFVYKHIKKNQYFFVIIEITLSLTAFFGFLGMIFLTIWFYRSPFEQPLLFNVICYLPVVIVGLLSGLELPTLEELLRKRTKNVQQFGNIIGTDYLGSLAGTLLFSLLLYPYAGLFVTLIIVTFLNILTAGFFAFYQKNRTIKLAIVILLIVYLALFYTMVPLQDRLIKEFRGAVILATDSFENPSYFNVAYLHSTRYQDVLLIEEEYEQDGETLRFECLYLDNDVQVCNSNVLSYHGGLVDFPMQYVQGDALDVLLIGAGDWIAVKNLKQFPQIRHITHIELDKEFATIAKTLPFLRRLHDGAYTDPRLETRYMDAFAYMLESKRLYDLIIYDLPGIKHDKAAHLYSLEFFSNAYRILKPEGVMAMWLYDIVTYPEHTEVLHSTLHEAGFTHYLPYASYATNYDEPIVTELFMLIANKPIKKQEQTSFYLDRTRDFYKDILWEELQTTKRPHSVFHPNRDIIIKPPRLI